jgi:fatty acid desaturase
VSEQHHHEKEEEKKEKEEEKKHEKQPDEKWRNDPVRAIMWAAILIWGGIVAMIDVAGWVHASWWQAWSVFLIGAGAILLIKAAVRLMPEYRRPVGGTVIIGIVLIGVGLGDIVGWNYTWPAILIVVGVILIARVFFRRR